MKMRAITVLRRLAQLREELLFLRGTPRSNRVAHNRKSALYRKRKSLTASLIRALEEEDVSPSDAVQMVAILTLPHHSDTRH
jgi:hypothetical protein